MEWKFWKRKIRTPKGGLTGSVEIDTNSGSHDALGPHGNMNLVPKDVEDRIKRLTEEGLSDPSLDDLPPAA